MPRCAICGIKCGWTYTISDKLYVVRENSPICATCFKRWAAGDDAYLDKMIGAKLKGTIMELPTASEGHQKGRDEDYNEHLGSKEESAKPEKSNKKG